MSDCKNITKAEALDRSTRSDAHLVAMMEEVSELRTRVHELWRAARTGDTANLDEKAFQALNQLENVGRDVERAIELESDTVHAFEVLVDRGEDAEERNAVLRRLFNITTEDICREHEREAAERHVAARTVQPAAE